MERKIVSSPGVARFFKIFAIIWIVLSIVIFIAFFDIVMIMIWIIASGIVFYFGFAIKGYKIEIDDNYLFITESGFETIIPITQISEVKEVVWSNPHIITINFQGETKYGKKLSFYPANFFTVGSFRHSESYNIIMSKIEDSDTR